MEFRRSKDTDKEEIYNLMLNTFGEHSSYDWAENLENRYLLAVENDRIVAITGITKSINYIDLEVDWTMRIPEYSNRNLIEQMLKMELEEVCEDVYCDCWRLKGREEVNLYRVMKSLGFEEIDRPNKHYQYKFHRCAGCRYCGGEDCECWIDLWVKRYNK